MKTTYVMMETATGRTVRKTQRTIPRMMGWVHVGTESPLRQGQFQGANGRYFARVMADGSHYQP